MSEDALVALIVGGTAFLPVVLIALNDWLSRTRSAQGRANEETLWERFKRKFLDELAKALAWVVAHLVWLFAVNLIAVLLLSIAAQ